MLYCELENCFSVNNGLRFKPRGGGEEFCRVNGPNIHINQACIMRTGYLGSLQLLMERRFSRTQKNRETLGQ